MSTSIMRDTLNSGNPNTLGDASQALPLGELLSYVIAKLGFTETGIAVTANVATLAAQPTAIFQVVGITAVPASTVKKLRKGPITGPNAIVPAAGEAVWDGALSVLFAAADVATTASFTYAVATDLASATMADLARG